MRSVRSVAALAALTAIACNPFAPDQTVILGVAELDAPTTVAANSPIDVVLKVEVNGCQSFTRLVAERSGNTASLTAWGEDASIGTKGVTCPSILRVEPHTYRFDPPFVGSFNITVNRGRLSPLTAQVQVQ